MIYVDRDRVEMGGKFEEKMSVANEGLEHWFKSSSKREESQLFGKIFGKMFSPMFRPALQGLQEVFFWKCAYCESSFLENHEQPEIDWFRPKQFAAQVKQKERSDLHYWWLSMEWRNLYLSCATCSDAKGNLFPLIGRRGGVRDSRELLEKKEKRLLIDPCLDAPEEHLDFDESGEILAKSEKGKVTIEVLQLNRRELVNLRGKKARECQDLVYRLAELDPKDSWFNEGCFQLASMTASKAAFAAVTRQAFVRHPAAKVVSELFKAQFSGKPENASFILETDIEGAGLEKGSLETAGVGFEIGERMSWLSRVEIENFRGLSKIVLPEDPNQELEDWLVLIGENGTGKSSILKAIALLFADEETRGRIAPKPGDLVNREWKGKSASVKAWFSHDLSQPVELIISRGATKDDPGSFKMVGIPPEIPVLAYGATRLPRRKGDDGGSEPRIQEVENLFDPWCPLERAEEYFANTKSLASDDFNVLAASLIKLLDLGNEDDEDDSERGYLTRRKGELFLKREGTSPIPISEESDGYQSLVTLVADMMRSFSVRDKDMVNASGLVLIDEIGCHLHPSWRIRIVDAMRAIFPKVRFVISTHEPLCLRGTLDNEVYRVYRQDGKVTVSLMNIPPGLTADQLLTGAWFGLSTTLDEDTLNLMEEHRKMLVKGVSEMAFQRRELEDKLSRRMSGGQYAETSTDRMVRTIAAEEIEKEAGSLKRLDESAREKIRDRVRERLKKK